MLGKVHTSLSAHGDRKFSRSKSSHCYLANGAIAPLSHTGQNAVRYQYRWIHQAATKKRMQTPAQGDRERLPGFHWSSTPSDQKQSRPLYLPTC